MAEHRPTPEIEYRPANEADILEQHAVFVAAEGALLTRHGFGWGDDPSLESFTPTIRHLMRRDGERFFVAVASGRVVGYSSVFVRDDTCYLAALFIDPGHQGMGVGQRLLELAFDGAPGRRVTITDSIQPVSNAIYARQGMFPVTPILGFDGEARVGPVPDLIAADPDPAGLAILDAAAYGFDRSVDHEFWATEATPTLWYRGDDPVAYSYRWPGGRIGPLAGLDQASAEQALLAELARAPVASMNIPGTSRTLVRVAFRSGMRLGAPAGLLLLSDDVEPPQALVIASYGLY